MIKSDFSDQEELHKLNAASGAHLYVKHVCASTHKHIRQDCIPTFSLVQYEYRVYFYQYVYVLIK